MLIGLVCSASSARNGIWQKAYALACQFPSFITYLTKNVFGCFIRQMDNRKNCILLHLQKTSKYQCEIKTIKIQMFKFQTHKLKKALKNYMFLYDKKQLFEKNCSPNYRMLIIDSKVYQ